MIEIRLSAAMNRKVNEKEEVYNKNFKWQMPGGRRTGFSWDFHFMHRQLAIVEYSAVNVRLES
jgi:hypothetical protein